jgi:hypothetical protein
VALQRAGARRVELNEALMRALKLFVGFAPAAGRAQQSNEGSLSGLVRGLNKAERARVAQRFFRYALEAIDESGQEPRAKPPSLLALRGTPAMKLLAIRQIELLEEIAVERLGCRA